MKLKYFVQSGDPLSYQTSKRGITTSISQMFSRASPNTYEWCRSIADADIVVWTGGSDVTPALYNKKALHETQFDINRDFNDLLAYRFSGNCKLRLGICRGAQFLNVLSGGSLDQHHIGSDEHPTGHQGQPHEMVRYSFKNLDSPGKEEMKDSKIYKVTSTHHQLMVPGKKAIVLGVAASSSFSSFSLCRVKYRGGSINPDTGGHSLVIPKEGAYEAPYEDAEVIWYPETKSLCIQGHPEYYNAEQEFVEDVHTMIMEVLG